MDRSSKTDETRSGDGRIRPNWQPIADTLDDLGPNGLLARQDDVARLLRTEGATYNDTSGPVSMRCPWVLDPVPFIISEDEWATLGASVAQRAALLQLVHADLHGPRRLVAEGLVPAELVLGNPAFLRPVTDQTGDRADRPSSALFTVAVDVIRGPDGTFIAMADKTQAPSGMGYAIVNRSTLSRVLPALHRRSGVERLAGFIRAIRSGVEAAAPEEAGDVRAVVLTPGPMSETYFEHAYLAAYLGYPLVEGRDLAVEHGRVWLRTLEGRDPIDVILRRVDDVWCDPVELRPDSLLGVPGLLDAVRRGLVTVLNPIGSGLLETPGISVQLERLAPALLGEELRLPGPPSWWCGTPEGLAEVTARWDHVVLVPAIPGNGICVGPIEPSRLQPEEANALLADVRARPQDWVGRQVLEASTVPMVGVDGVLADRPISLRSFAVRDYSTDGPRPNFVVLPGGLARVLDDVGAFAGSGATSPISKDTWVVSSGPILQQSPWLPLADTSPTIAIQGGVATPLPARAAAQLFLLGRSAEHAELLIRLVRAVQLRIDQPLDIGKGHGADSLRVLLAALEPAAAFDPRAEPILRRGSSGLEDRPTRDDPDESELATSSPLDSRSLTLLFDPQVAGGLVATVGVVVDAAYSVRDQLSADSWQLVGDLDEGRARLVASPPTHLAAAQPALAGLLRSLLALAGMSAENMERDPSWRFLDAGRRLERARASVRLLASVLTEHRSGVAEDLLVESLLRTSESLMIFRRRSGPVLHVAGALDLLVYDAANPRSIRFQFDRLEEHLGNLPPGFGTDDRTQLVARAAAPLQATDALRLAAVDPATDRRTELESVLDDVDARLAELHDSVRRGWFTPQRLSALAGGGMSDGDRRSASSRR